MKYKLLIILFLFGLSNFIFSQKTIQKDSFSSTSSGYYLEQEPPGETPEELKLK